MSRTHWFSLFFLIIHSLSCSQVKEKETSHPANVLEPEIMAQVLAETQLADAAINLQIFEKNKLKPEKKSLYEMACKKHKVNPSAFQASYQYYLSKPDEFTEIYEQTIRILNEKELELKTKN